MKYHYILGFCLFFIFSLNLNAQQYLPWYTDFDTVPEQNAWTEYRLGTTEFYNWNFPAAANSYPSHDYPVGNGGTDTTIDWLVSPEIYFHSSAKLDMSANVYSLIGLTPEDRFEVWMSTGSADPADGDYAMVADLTEFGINGQWTDTAGIVLSDTGLGYIALVYAATNNWFTVAADSIKITPDVPLDTADTATGISLQRNSNAGFSLWPNPADERISISTEGIVGTVTATVMDARGAVKLESKWTARETAKTLAVNDLPSGVYFVRLSTADASVTKQLIVR